MLVGGRLRQISKAPIKIADVLCPNRMGGGRGELALSLYYRSVADSRPTAADIETDVKLTLSAYHNADVTETGVKLIL